MRVSFDLDDTLICYDEAVPREPTAVPFLLRRWFREPLRLGTRRLAGELVRRGCTLSVYTTSYRSPRKLVWWFWFYGIRIESVINQEIHDQFIKAGWNRRKHSKHPSRFGIDLHIDDSEGVRMEGEENGSDVLVVRPEDADWVNTILTAVDLRLRNRATQTK